LSVEVGDRISVIRTGVTGVVRHVGETHFASGVWVGIELDEPSGKNDGSVQGQRYFTCEHLWGIFLRPTAIVKCPGLGATSGDGPAPQRDERAPEVEEDLHREPVSDVAASGEVAATVGEAAAVVAAGAVAAASTAAQPIVSPRKSPETQRRSPPRSPETSQRRATPPKSPEKTPEKSQRITLPEDGADISFRSRRWQQDPDEAEVVCKKGSHPSDPHNWVAAALGVQPWVLAVVGTLCFCAFVLWGFMDELMCSLAGFLYPMFGSYKALADKSTDEVGHWLRYWVTFAIISLIEGLLYRPLQALPQYHLLRLLFRGWLFLPATCGAEFLYRWFLRPLLRLFRPRIEASLARFFHEVRDPLEKDFGDRLRGVAKRGQGFVTKELTKAAIAKMDRSSSAQ